MYLCGFVSLYVKMFVARANKVEGTMILMLRNLSIYLNMALVKVEQGHFETAILILHNFFVFYYGYRCLEALHKISS